MEKYYDINKREEISLDLFVHQIFSLAIKRLKLKLNKGYDSEDNPVKEVLTQSGKDQELYIPSYNLLDIETMQREHSRSQEALENELAFEDDVLVYLMQTLRSVATKSLSLTSNLSRDRIEMTQRIRKELPTLTKAIMYSSTADRLILGMALGVFPADDFRREFSQECYGFASALESSKLGRWNGRALVHHKLERKFNRYFGIIAEAAEVAYQSKSQGARGLLTPPPTIDDLLDKLNTAKDEEERNIILKELKERKN